MSNQNETTPNPKPPNRNEPLDENQTFDAVPSIDDLISEKQSEDHSENANFDQTIDLSQSVPAKADPTMDLDSLSDQTVEFSVDQSDGGTSASVSLPNAPLDEISISEMGTMILPKEQAPFWWNGFIKPLGILIGCWYECFAKFHVLRSDNGSLLGEFSEFGDEEVIRLRPFGSL